MSMTTVTTTAFATNAGVDSIRPSEVGAWDHPNIWTEFIALAAQYDAVNLGQGFPNTPIPANLSRHLTDIASQRELYHQYTRGYGHPRLVNVLAEFYGHLLGLHINAMDDVLVTVGAYLGLYYTFMGWLNPGDEVLIFEPAFDSYVEQIAMTGARAVPVVLDLKLPADGQPLTSAAYVMDIEKVYAKLTPRTKMIVLNNPNNPTGKLFTRAELEALAQLAAERNLLVLTDEVYEYHIYKPGEMIRFASLPGMYERTLTVCSAGKAFSITGWKLGWVIAPKNLLKPLKNIHENCIFAAPTDHQEAVAREFENELMLHKSGKLEDSFLATGMAALLAPKRDKLANALRAAGFNPIVPDAGYFMIADFKHIDGAYKSEPNDATGKQTALDYKFVRWLCREKNLAVIPPSAFYSPQNREGNDNFIRLCFYKTEETLDAGIEILKSLSTDGSSH